jgi:hypothetical protein
LGKVVVFGTGCSDGRIGDTQVVNKMFRTTVVKKFICKFQDLELASEFAVQPTKFANCIKADRVIFVLTKGESRGTANDFVDLIFYRLRTLKPNTRSEVQF